MSIEIHLEPELEAELERLSRESGQPKSLYAEAAIRDFLEDQYFFKNAEASYERAKDEPRISLEELGRKLGLHD